MKKRRRLLKPNESLRDTKTYKIIRRNVLIRDKYKCQYPGCKSRTRKWLQVHHIIPYARSSSLISTERNLITLCWRHHKSIQGKEMHYIMLFAEIIKGKYYAD
jgi:5-methylcytosine-specific restriction endonuclease McrA